VTDPLQDLKGKEVVLFFQGVSYRGTLIDSTDSEVYLKTATESIALPMDGISEIRAA
jgi:hypothetical protein